MDSHEFLLVDLLNDSTCKSLMLRDGVRTQDVLSLMRSVKPLALQGSARRRQKKEPTQVAA